MKKTSALTIILIITGFSLICQAQQKWIPLFNGKDLTGWFIHGKTQWSVQNGLLVGEGGMGHIYTDVKCNDFEAKGTFRISENGNSGFYFRANPPEDNPDGFPRGYEAQICNSQEAYTGWLWKPGKPTGKATELLTKDGEWFNYRIRAVGSHIEFWINDKPVMTYDDTEYKSGHFAIQGHNPGMKIEARDLYYRDLSGSK
jgi:3-keto-disaccharide hydrolase